MSQTLSTAATTLSITSPCRCCWGNPSTWKCGCWTPRIPVWCCWCTSVWPTPALETRCGCCFTMGASKHQNIELSHEYIYNGEIEEYQWDGRPFNPMLIPRCPNPLDPAPHQVVLSAPRPPSPRGQTRRFTISTFQFLHDGEFKDPNEEVRMSRVPEILLLMFAWNIVTLNCVFFYYFVSPFPAGAYWFTTYCADSELEVWRKYFYCKENGNVCWINIKL